MPLHPASLPNVARHLFRIVALQKRLLRELIPPHINAAHVTTAWVQDVWTEIDPEWVRLFCLGGQLARLKAIAAAALVARQALYDEFCLQNKVYVMVNAGGDFRDLSILPGFTPALTKAVKEFFVDCYDLLGQSSRTSGYSLPGARMLTKRSYNDAFREQLPTKLVCPYCDSDIGTAELDHYYCISHFPLLACSPWNLLPICKSCNDATTAKGNRLALAPGPPRSANDWLHPFVRPASTSVTIRLIGPPRESIPQLHAPSAAEQQRLDNHHWLMDRLDKDPPFRSLSKRWTAVASGYFDSLIPAVNRRLRASTSIDQLVRERLEDHQAVRGQEASSMARAAVCQAILDLRPEYLEEFTNPNRPMLV